MTPFAKMYVVEQMVRSGIVTPDDTRRYIETGTVGLEPHPDPRAQPREHRAWHRLRGPHQKDRRNP